MATSAVKPAPHPATAAAKPAAGQLMPVVKTKQPLSASAYIAIVASIATLIVVVCMFILWRLVGNIFLEFNVLAKEATANSQLTKKLSDASTLVSNYNNLGGNQQRLINDALPESASFNQLVALMDQLATSSSVTIKTISPSSQNGASGAASSSSSSSSSGSGAAPTPYVFSMEVEGPYTQIVQYFHNLELSVRPMRVEDVTFNGNASDLKATVDIETFYQGSASISDKQEVVK